MMIAVIGGKKPSKMDKLGGSMKEREVESDESEDEGGDATEARHEAAKALIRAVKMGDPSAVDEALEAHREACEAGGYED